MDIQYNSRKKVFYFTYNFAVYGNSWCFGVNNAYILNTYLFAGGSLRSAPRLSLPGKLVFPSTQNAGHFSMLGLGDIVMPGLLLCFVMRYILHTIQYTIQLTGMHVVAYIFNISSIETGFHWTQREYIYSL